MNVPGRSKLCIEWNQHSQMRDTAADCSCCSLVLVVDILIGNLVVGNHMVAVVGREKRNILAEGMIQVGEGQVCCNRQTAAHNQAEASVRACYSLLVVGPGMRLVEALEDTVNWRTDRAGSDSDDTTFQLGVADQNYLQSRQQDVVSREWSTESQKLKVWRSVAESAGDDDERSG